MTHLDDGQLGLHRHSYDARYAIDQRYVVYTGDGRGWLARTSHAYVEDGLVEWNKRRAAGETARLVDTEVGINQQGIVLRSTEATGSSPSAPRAPRIDALARVAELDEAGQVRVSPLPTLEEWEQLWRGHHRQAGV